MQMSAFSSYRADAFKPVSQQWASPLALFQPQAAADIFQSVTASSQVQFGDDNKQTCQNGVNPQMLEVYMAKNPGVSREDAIAELKAKAAKARKAAQQAQAQQG